LIADFKRIARTVATTGTIARAFLPLVKGRGTIFMMHRFRDPDAGIKGHDPALLHSALDDLKHRGFRLVSLLELVSVGREGGDLSRMVAFTVDDGHADFHRIAAPIFIDHGCPVTVFPATDFVDRKAWLWPDRVRFMMDHTARRSLGFGETEKVLRLEWDDEQSRAVATQDLTWALVAMEGQRRQDALKVLEEKLDVTVPDDVVPAYEPMTWDEAREDAQRGVSFAPHSVSHPNMGLLDAAQVQVEILRSWQRVKEEIEDAAPVFCYPFGRRGDCPPVATDALREAQFSAAVTAVPGHVTALGLRKAPYFLPRFPWPDELEDVRQVVFGLEEAKAMVRSGGRRPRWPHP
jgi:peptidoglycan/xylan/chitin deacetylase (PgdA/CDA1 family)